MLSLHTYIHGRKAPRPRRLSRPDPRSRLWGSPAQSPVPEGVIGSVLAIQLDARPPPLTSGKLQVQARQSSFDMAPKHCKGVTFFRSTARPVQQLGPDIGRSLRVTGFPQNGLNDTQFFGTDMRTLADQDQPMPGLDRCPPGFTRCLVAPSVSLFPIANGESYGWIAAGSLRSRAE